MRRLLVLAVALAQIACGDDDASGPDDSNQLVVGALLSLTGPGRTLGQTSEAALQLAADDLNAAGGVLGRRLEIVPGDDGCDAAMATAAAQAMLATGIVGVAGGSCSGSAIPATAVLDPKGIPYVSGFATNPALTERGLRTVFRVTGRDDDQADFAARFLAGPEGVKKLALLHDHTVYAKGLAELVRSANDELKLGMQVVFFDAITPGERDYSSTLTRIKGSGADTLYFTGYLAEAGLIVRQAKELGLPARMTGGDATQDPAVIKTAGPAAEGFIVTTSPLPQFLPAAAGFTQAFTERFGAPPGPYSVYEYDAVKVLADAVGRAASADPRKVGEALRTTRHEGVTGLISFDAKGDREKTAYVTAIVRDGKFRPHQKLGPAGNWVDG